MFLLRRRWPGLLSPDVAPDHRLWRLGSRHSGPHAAAVVAYARHYGGISDAKTATMCKVGVEAMELEVDGKPVQVPFDHPLSDSEDAHRTLVAMLRALPRPAPGTIG